MTSVASAYVPGPGGYYNPSDNSGPYSISSAGVVTLIGSGASGGSGSAVVTSAAAGGVGAPFRLPTSAASTNATRIKTGAGRVYKIRGINNAAAVRRLKFYDSVLSPPVPGTTAIFDVFILPVGAFSFDMADLGWSFTNGIGFALLQGSADSDTTAVAAGDITDLSIAYA